ncbi:hypothetical protein Ae263Ps1_0856 [Pseudonocardia sp. Ae263_Ps1]|nr:hypothetical protein Ae150APs1_4465c [Pseudonocardia sp. Ae150A_Ps1]OLL83801.1 hypothetical protein Ae263Ps1_0856 [Pseudonocardia sp. Ae263_Ps1]
MAHGTTDPPPRRCRRAAGFLDRAARPRRGSPPVDLLRGPAPAPAAGT